MLGNFSYCNPTKLYFGEKALGKLGTELKKYGPNVVLVYGGGSVKKNGIYDEVMEGFEGSTKNIIKLTEDSLDVTKKGVTNVHMVFEENKKNITYYNTPFGNLFIGIDAEKIQVEESEENINVNVAYALEANYEHLADCRIQMNIKSKDARDFKLQA